MVTLTKRKHLFLASVISTWTMLLFPVFDEILWVSNDFSHITNLLETSQLQLTVLLYFGGVWHVRDRLVEYTIKVCCNKDVRGRAIYVNLRQR